MNLPAHLDAGAMERLDAEFETALPDSLHRMAGQIRVHPVRNSGLVERLKGRPL